MTNNQFTKIHTDLKFIRKWIADEGGLVCPHKFGTCKHDNENCPIFRIDQIRSILPSCKICNGSKTGLYRYFKCPDC